jgi:hypothetical protein
MLELSLAGPGLAPLALPFLALGITAFFLPFGLGNPGVAWLVGRLHPRPAPGEEGFVVQLALAPRVRSGLWAIMEDADDIGWLSLTEVGLKFQGDSVQIWVPFQQVSRVRLLNVGLRGLFVYGARIVVQVEGLPNFQALEFAERSSWLLPASRRTTRRLHERLLVKAQKPVNWPVPGTHARK